MDENSPSHLAHYYYGLFGWLLGEDGNKAALIAK